MIKIIKPGTNAFIGKCDKCGCEFTYESEDISYYFVKCPQCNEKYCHTSQSNLKSSVYDPKAKEEYDKFVGRNWF